MSQNIIRVDTIKEISLEPGRIVTTMRNGNYEATSVGISIDVKDGAKVVIPWSNIAAFYVIPAEQETKKTK